MGRPVGVVEDAVLRHLREALPDGGGVGRVMKIGPQTVNTQLSAYKNVVHPAGGAKA